MANPQNIEKHKFPKGQTGNPNGRPRKYVSLLTEQGYKRSEINDTISAMMAMTLDELAEVYRNPLATILEKTIAGAMKKSLEKGTLYSLETLMSRVHGVPNQTVNQVVSERPIFNEIDLDVPTDNSAS